MERRLCFAPEHHVAVDLKKHSSRRLSFGLHAATAGGGGGSEAPFRIFQQGDKRCAGRK